MHAMATPMTAQSDLLGALTWRCIGPFRGGRVVAVAGDPIHPMTFYFGACAGGVWKTTDGGTYWQNVSFGREARTVFLFEADHDLPTRLRVEFRSRLDRSPPFF